MSIFDRMTDNEQHAVLAALEALRDESGHYLTVKADQIGRGGLRHLQPSAKRK